jgi:ParB-like chromosome segregation protein Spo0J
MDAYRHSGEAELLPLARRWPPLARTVAGDRVRALASAMRRGVTFPPVRVVIGLDGRFSVQDGAHRLEASVLAGFTHIPAIINPSPWPTKA